MEKERNDLQSSSVGDSLGMNKAFVFNCPYLGTLEDSETSLAYPAAANYCFRVDSPAAVELSHQENYCLTDQHSGCHVFQMVNAPATIPGSEAPPPVRDKKKRLVSLFALPIILILLLLAAIVWWPAPGTTLQDSLVLGARSDREVTGGTSLNDNPVSEPVLVEEPEIAAVPAEDTEPVAGVSLNGPAEQVEEKKINSSSAETASGSADNNRSQSSAGAYEPLASNQPAEPAGPMEQIGEVVEAAVPAIEKTAASTVTDNSTVSITSTVVEQDASTETTEAAIGAEIADVGTSSTDVEQDVPTEPTDEAADTETFSVVKSSTKAGQDASTETTEAAAEPKTSNTETASSSVEETAEAAEQEIASEEDVAESAADEEESTAVTTADLPIISSDIPAVTTAPERPAPPNAGGGLVALVGPVVSSALSLHADVEDVNELLVYQAPTSDSELLTFIEERQFVTLLGRDSSGTWLNVRLNGGTEGWIDLIQSGASVDASTLPNAEDGEAAETIVAEQPVPSASSFPVIRSAAVDTGALNVRSGPGLQYEPITIIGNGEIVGLIGRRTLGPWVRIRLGSGLEGWVNSSLLAQAS